MSTIAIAMGLLLASAACEMVPSGNVGRIPEAVRAVPEKKPAGRDLSAMMAMLSGERPQGEVEEAPAEEEAAAKPRRVRRTRVVTPDEAWMVPEEAVLPSLPPEPEPEVEVLTEAQFYAVIGGWDGVKHCLQSSDIPNVDRRIGAITVSFEIAVDGAVTGSKVRAASATAQSMTDCIERQARKIAFRLKGEPRKPITRSAKFVYVGRGARLVM